MNLFLQKTLDIFFPATCHVCQKDIFSGWANAFVCPSCFSQIHGETFTKVNLDPLQYLFSPFSFEGPMRSLVHAFKYGGKDYLGTLFGSFCAERFPFDKGFDSLVPIPTSYWKGWCRGYNPAELLAVELGERWHKPVKTKWLHRNLFSISQTHLNRKKRMTNACKSYSFEGTVSVKGQRILLVDDVFTTGATLKVCAELLLKGGAKWVAGCTLAFDPLKTD